MEKLQNKLIKFFESLSTKNRLLFIIGILIVLVLFYMIFINGNYRGSDINYRKANIETIINTSSYIYDRDQIMALDEVIDKILKIKNETWAIDTKFVTLNNLYSQTLTDNYKNFLSKSKFKKKMNEIYSNVLDSNGYNKDKNYTKQVYYSAEYNTYLVELNTLTDIKSYIGIRLVNNTYVISYLE